MSTFKATRVLPHSAEQLFNLVLDIDAYAQFLPMCAGSRVTERHKDHLLADLDIAYGPLHETFTSRVTWCNYDWIQAQNHGHGPVKAMHTRWLFEPTSQGCCQLTCMVQVELNGGLLNMILNQAMNHLAEHMIQAFAQRAQTLFPQERVQTRQG